MKTRMYYLCGILLISTTIFAQTSVWTGGSDIWTRGAGTQASPYLIESADQLSFIAEMVNAGVTDYQGKWFRLTKDMDLNHLEWSPIGESDEHSFKGNLDGNNHTISNLRVISNTYAGLFGYISNATITNITLRGDSIVGVYAGSLVGFADSCEIINIQSETPIFANHFAGGVIGYARKCRFVKCGNIEPICSWVISNSDSQEINTKNTSTTDSYSGYKTINNYYSISLSDNLDSICAGGIVGFANSCCLYECANYGEVTAIFLSTRSLNYNKVRQYQQNRIYYTIDITTLSGGVCGGCGKTSLYLSHNYGSVISSMDIGNFNISGLDGSTSNPNIYSVQGGRPSSGGVIGLSTKNDTIRKCSNYGDIVSTSVSKTVTGYGIVGYGSGNVEYCYNIGSCAYGIGGASVKNSYNAGATSSLGISSGTVTNCYYLHGSGNGTPKTEAQMKSVSLPILLNVDSTVFIQDTQPYVNNGFPILNECKYVVTNSAENVSFTSVELKGAYKGFTPDSIGFEVMPNNRFTCSTTTFQLNGLSQGTTYVARFWSASNGTIYCGDTIQFTTLQCPTEPAQVDSVNICSGEEYLFGGISLSETGIYFDTLLATTGCDSIIELKLNVLETFKYIRFDTIMLGDVYDFYGDTLRESGVYNEYIPSTIRCNQIELHLYVKRPDRMLVLLVNDSTMGIVSGGGVYEDSTFVEISALPNLGYRFVQWSDSVTSAERTILLFKDLELTAEFAPIDYIIMFLNSDSTLLQLDTLAYGAMPEYHGENPVKPNEGENFFVFAGWEPSIVAVTGDATYIATYESHGTGVAIPNETKQPIKIWREGQLYILLPDGTRYTATGKKVE